LTFHNKLFDETDTTKVGALQGQCVRESPRAGTWECWWTMSLADGQVTVEGPFSDTADTVFAVTGGTGSYENGRGSMQVESIDGGAEYKQTISLIP
jgi:allene oxide cyclase